jgi:hypothetical protein
MKKLLLATMLLLPTILFAEELPVPEPSAATISCQSTGSGTIPLTLSFSATSQWGELQQGVLSSVGTMSLSFNVNVKNEKKSADQFSFDFSAQGEANQTIEGKYSVDLKEVEIDGEKVKVPTGQGTIDLTIMPELGIIVLNKYALTNCIGMVK